MAIDKKFGRINIPNVPDDEPVFVIRGKDKAAVNAIRSYARAAYDIGAGQVLLENAHDCANEIKDWQEGHPEQVKVPD